MASAGKARQVTDTLMTKIMEKNVVLFFSGAKMSYSQYNKKERRMAKQLQEHHSLYKAPDSSKDIVKPTLGKLYQGKRNQNFKWVSKQQCQIIHQNVHQEEILQIIPIGHYHPLNPHLLQKN